MNAIEATMSPPADPGSEDGRDHVVQEPGESSGSTLAETFDSFVVRERDRLLALAYTLTGSQTAAEDLTQETFLRLYQQWRRVSEYERPGAWVRRVLMNLAFSRSRRLRNEARTMFRLVRERRNDTPNMPSPTENFWATIRSLPPRQAEVLVLFYAEDRSTADIAEILGVADGTVRALLHQGRLAARQRLELHARQEGSSE